MTNNVLQRRYRTSFRTILLLLCGVISNFNANALSSDLSSDLSSQCRFVITPGQDSIRAITLTKEVFDCTGQTNLSDLIIKNAAGQSVPLLTMHRQQPKVEVVEVVLPFYRQPQQASFSSTEQLDKILRVANFRVTDKSLITSEKRHISSMIVDLSKVEGQLVNITIDAPQAQTIEATIVMEVSNDLTHWRIINKPQRYYWLEGSEGALHRKQFSLPHYRAENFIRLSIISSNADFHNQIEHIHAQINKMAPTAQLNWSGINAAVLNSDTGRWQYSWSNYLPVEKLRFMPKSQTPLYSGQIYRRLLNKRTEPSSSRRKN